MLVADVAGHGAEAGLVAARFKQRVTALLSTDLDLLAAFVAAADKLDDDDERFLSCLLVEVHPATGRLRWINAGHPSGLIAHGVGNDLVVRELGPTGPLIGAVEHCWTVEETSLAPGELLLAMTDGVVEARRGADEEFGTEGVLVTLRRMRQLSAQGTVT